MAEKKTTKAAEKKTTKTAAEKATKKCATRKSTAKASVISLTAENAGFKAGDVYQALAAADAAMSVADIAKAAEICVEEVLLGMGWLFKEGKIVAVEDKVALA